MMREGDEDYMQRSKELLVQNLEKKLMTTMVGALYSIEENLVKTDKISEQDYDMIRQEILDKGNKQIKNMKKELSNYSVNWKRFKTVIPMKRTK